MEVCSLYETLFITTEINKFDLGCGLFTGGDGYCFHAKPIKKHHVKVLITLLESQIQLVPVRQCLMTESVYSMANSSGFLMSQLKSSRKTTK